MGFFLVSHHGPEPWPSSQFPAEAVLDSISALPPHRRRVPTISSLYGERIANVFFRAPDRRLLSIENVELGARVRESVGGQIGNRTYGPDEGLAFQTYVMFLERNIVGIVRLDRGPYPKQLCIVIEVLAKYGLDLTPLVDPKIGRRIAERDSNDVARLKFRALLGRGDRIRQASTLGRVFEVAEEVFPNAYDFTLAVSVREEAQRGRFWRNSKAAVVDRLLADEEALEQFEEAEIGLTYGKSIDLLEQLIIWKGSVPVDESRHIDEKTIALAIQEAYADQRGAILEAVGAL